MSDYRESSFTFIYRYVDEIHELPSKQRMDELVGMVSDDIWDYMTYSRPRRLGIVTGKQIGRAHV